VDDNGHININWLFGPPAPEAVLKFLSCKCKRKCVVPTCQCIGNGLKCTDACFLQACENMRTDECVEDDKVVQDGESSDEDSYLSE